MKFIRYLWAYGNVRIEMAGMFTPESWKRFCEQPHPMRRGITIIPL